MSKLFLLFLLVFILGCNSDYKKNLGQEYELIKTNSCCIFIFNQNSPIETITNQRKISIFSDNRIIKPLITKIWFNDNIIIGYKIKNTCCYLADYEMENLDGYFLINKQNKKVYDGLDLKRISILLYDSYNIDIQKINFQALR